MEILFENQYVVTKQKYLDWVNHPIKKSGIAFMKYIWIVFILITAFMCFNSILNKDVLFAGYFILLAIFCIYRAFFRTGMLASKQFKLLANSQGAIEWIRTIQFADKITVIDGCSTTQYEYDKFNELVDSQNYIALVIGQLNIRLDKNGFKNGNTKEFIDFIKSEHLNIVVHTG